MDIPILVLDCREMQPPEPMITVLSALPSLQKGQKIKMLHRMVPNPLFEKLQEKGFHYQLEGETPAITIWIWKEDSCTKD